MRIDAEHAADGGDAEVVYYPLLRRARNPSTRCDSSRIGHLALLHEIKRPLNLHDIYK